LGCHVPERYIQVRRDFVVSGGGEERRRRAFRPSDKADMEVEVFYRTYAIGLVKVII
jgi:hypothetical protein